MTALAAWQNFYVIVGSSAGALIGLQFVVLSLVSDGPVARIDAEVGGAFATPTIAHFGAVLLLAAILSAPWDWIGGAATLCGMVGICGAVHTAVTTRRLRALTKYQAQLEDWVFFALLPFAAYVTLPVSAYFAWFHLREALFGVATAVLLLLFIGIHNAWDAVTYHMFVKNESERKS